METLRITLHTPIPDIIEIGAIKLGEDMSIVDTFSCFINPGKNIGSYITNLTGITQKMVDGAEDWPTVADKFMKFIGQEHAIAAWPISFELPVLKKAYARLNQDPINYRGIDIATIAKMWIIKKRIDAKGMNVIAVADTLGTKIYSPIHRALPDAMTEYEIFKYVWFNFEKKGK